MSPFVIYFENKGGERVYSGRQKLDEAIVYLFISKPLKRRREDPALQELFSLATKAIFREGGRRSQVYEFRDPLSVAPVSAANSLVLHNN